MGRVINLFEHRGNVKGGYNLESAVTLDIEDVVREIRVNHDIQGAPIDPVSIASACNIGVYKVNFNQYNNDSVSGAIEKRDGTVNIYVNENDSLLRQRFTIAHELGHYFLHMNSNDDYEVVDLRRTSGYASNNPREIQANTFAASLLMEAELVKERFLKLKSIGFTQNYIIEMLADQFAVSKAAMAYRISKLGLQGELQ